MKTEGTNLLLLIISAFWSSRRQRSIPLGGRYRQVSRYNYVCYSLSLPPYYCDVIMGALASQITSLTIVYPTVYSGTDDRKRQSSASMAFMRGIHRWTVNSPHKGPVTRKMFPFDDVIMYKIFSIYHETQDVTSRYRWDVGARCPSGIICQTSHPIYTFVLNIKRSRVAYYI